MDSAKIFLSLVAIFGFWNSMASYGEDAKSGHGKSNPTASAKTWAGVELDGLILDLQDDKSVLWLLFHRDGYVAVTVGQRGGGLAAPLCTWKVSGEWMQVFEDEPGSKLWFQIRLLKKTDKTMTVENGAGETQIFAIKQR